MGVEQAGEVQRLRLGHDMPENSILHAATLRLAEALEEGSGGRLQVEIYPSQQLGDDHQMLEMTRRGELDLLLIPTAKLSVALPRMQLLDLPFYFPTANDVYSLLDGAPGQMLLDSMGEIGLVGLTFWGGGFKQFTANRPLLTEEDFAGGRFRVMKSRLLQAQFELLGAEAIPIDFHQLRRALADGVVDGQENPLVAIKAMGIHQVQSHLTLSNHAYLAYALAISEARFVQLPVSLQRLIIDSARKITPWMRTETERQEVALLAELGTSGLDIQLLGGYQRAYFRDRLRPLVARFESTLGADLLAASDRWLYPAPNPRQPPLIVIDVNLSPASDGTGVEIKRGAQLALEALSADRGLEIDLLASDNRGQAERAQRNLATLDPWPNWIGTISGRSAGSMLDRPEPQGRALLAAWMGDIDLFGDELPDWLYGVTKENPGMADFIRRQFSAGERLGLIGEASPGGESFSRQLMAAARQAGILPGGRLDITPGYPPGEEDKAALEALAAGSDRLVLAVRAREREALIELLAEKAPLVPLISLFEGLPDKGLRLHCLTTAPDSAAYRALAQRYQQTYGDPVRYPSALAQGHDAAVILAHAVEQAELSGEMTAERVRQQLEHLPAIDGLIREYAPAFAPGRHLALGQPDYRLASQGCTLSTETRP